MQEQIITNLLAFLERVEVKGPEAYAWVKAHQFVRAMLADLEQQPVPPVSQQKESL